MITIINLCHALCIIIALHSGVHKLSALNLLFQLHAGFHNYNTDYRTESVFGSSIYGNCSSVINYASHHSGIPVHRGSICNGASVLNNGVIPSLR